MGDRGREGDDSRAGNAARPARGSGDAPTAVTKPLSKMAQLQLAYAAPAKPKPKPKPRPAPPPAPPPAAPAPVAPPPRERSPRRAAGASPPPGARAGPSSQRARVGVVARLHDAFRGGATAPEARAAALAAALDATPRDRVTLAELDAAVACVTALPDTAERAALSHTAAQLGFPFSALRCVIDRPELLRGALAAVRGAMGVGASPAAAWAWPAADRESLCGRFASMPAVREYADVAPALRGLGAPGAAAAAALEAALLRRVCADFEAQLGGSGDGTVAPARLDAKALLAQAQEEHAAAQEAAAAERRAAKAAAAEVEAAAAAARRQRAAAASAAPAAPAAAGVRVAEARRAAQLEADAKRATEAMAALERQKSALAAKLAAERARADAAVAAAARLAAQVAPPPGAPPAGGRPRRTSASSRATQPAADAETAALASGADAASSPADAAPFVAQHNTPVDTAPTEEEIAEYAVFLGMDPETDKELFYIAAWALTAPLPAGWSEHTDDAGNEFFYNERTGVSTFAHPLDELYRNYWRGIKAGTIPKAGAAAQAPVAEAEAPAAAAPAGAETAADGVPNDAV